MGKHHWYGEYQDYRKRMSATYRATPVTGKQLKAINQQEKKMFQESVYDLTGYFINDVDYDRFVNLLHSIRENRHFDFIPDVVEKREAELREAIRLIRKPKVVKL